MKSGYDDVKPRQMEPITITGACPLLLQCEQFNKQLIVHEGTIDPDSIKNETNCTISFQINTENNTFDFKAFVAQWDTAAWQSGRV